METFLSAILFPSGSLSARAGALARFRNLHVTLRRGAGRGKPALGKPMRRSLPVFLFFAALACRADIPFTEHPITGLADGAMAAYAADLDQDGDLDVAVVSALDATIAWYENDGAMNF